MYMPLTMMMMMMMHGSQKLGHSNYIAFENFVHLQGNFKKKKMVKLSTQKMSILFKHTQPHMFLCAYSQKSCWRHWFHSFTKVKQCWVWPVLTMATTWETPETMVYHYYMTWALMTHAYVLPSDYSVCMQHRYNYLDWFFSLVQGCLMENSHSVVQSMNDYKQSCAYYQASTGCGGSTSFAMTTVAVLMQ